MAQTVEWISDQHDRIVVAAHNGHVQRWPASVAGVGFTPMGMHLADRLGDDYRVIGTTCGTGRTPVTEIGAGKMFTELEAPQTGSLDAVMDASHRGPFAVDLQRLSPADATTIRAISQQRLAHLYCDTSPLQAFGIVIHVPRVNLADPDLSAFTQHPRTYSKPSATQCRTNNRGDRWSRPRSRARRDRRYTTRRTCLTQTADPL